jgi:hypothetical protein
LSPSEEIRSITSINLAQQEEEALKIRPPEEGVGLSLTLLVIEEGGELDLAVH